MQMAALAHLPSAQLQCTKIVGVQWAGTQHAGCCRPVVVVALCDLAADCQLGTAVLLPLQLLACPLVGSNAGLLETFIGCYV